MRTYVGAFANTVRPQIDSSMERSWAVKFHGTLDECESDYKYSLLKKIRNLIKRLDSQDPAGLTYILKVMVSGRPDEEILPLAKQLEVTVADTAWDIGVLIDSRVRQFANRRPSGCTEPFPIIEPARQWNVFVGCVGDGRVRSSGRSII